MLFRTIDGKLIYLNKYDFKNDKLYLQNVMKIMKPFSKLEKTFNTRGSYFNPPSASELSAKLRAYERYSGSSK